jgi:hypothetical protein
MRLYVCYMKHIDNLLVDLVGQTSKTTHTSLSQIRHGFAPGFCRMANYYVYLLEEIAWHEVTSVIDDERYYILHELSKGMSL